MAPWKGPRHRSWASDTVLTSVAAIVVIVVYIVWELFGEAPDGMVTLVGMAGGAIFGAVSGDNRKKAAEVKEQAQRTEAKTDALTAATDREHPGTADEVHRASGSQGGGPA